MKLDRSVKDRTGIIGCSQLGSLLNVSSYGTPYNVYLDYTGKSEKIFTKEQEESMAMGTFFEDMIAKYGAKKYGVKIRRSNKAYVHPRIPQFICHPDRLVVGRVDGLRVGIECKMVQPYAQGWGVPDTDEVPDDYHLQSEGYISCDVCDIVWLFVMKGNRIYRYIIPRDEELIAMIEFEVETFIKNVENGVEYYQDSYKLVQDTLKDSEPNKIKFADERIEKLCDLYSVKNKQYKTLEKELDAIKAEIGMFMQDSEIILNSQEKKLVSFKKEFRTSFNKNKLKEDHPDIYEKYTEVLSNRVMRFSRRKK